VTKPWEHKDMKEYPFPEEVLYHMALMDRGVDPFSRPSTAEAIQKRLDTDIQLLEDESPVVSGYAMWWAGLNGDPRAIYKQYERIRAPKSGWGNAHAEWSAEGLAHSSKRNPLAAEVYAKHVLGNTRYPVHKTLLWSENGANPLEKPAHEDVQLIDRKISVLFDALGDSSEKVIAARVLINRGPMAHPKHVDYLMDALTMVERKTDEKGVTYVRAAPVAQVAVNTLTRTIRPSGDPAVVGRLMHHAKNAGTPVGKNIATIALSRQPVNMFTKLSGEGTEILKTALANKDDPGFACAVAEHLCVNRFLRSPLSKDIVALLPVAPPDLQKKIAFHLSLVTPLDPTVRDAIWPHLSDDRRRQLDMGQK